MDIFPAEQKGSALLMALFITAIAAIISISLLDRQSIDIERTALTIEANQAYLYAQGAEIWADHYLLGNIYPTTTGNTKYPWNAWPVIMPMQKLPNGGSVTAILMDAQSLYNINDLQDENQQTVFMQFLTNLLPGAYSQNTPNIVSGITNWISPLGQNANVNLEEYYLNHQPPYQSGHTLFAMINELRLVNGVTQQVYNISSPYLIALPVTTMININSAPAMVLTTLSNTMTLSQAQQLVSLRNSSGGFATLGDFAAIPLVQQLALNQSNITTTSNYFLLRVDVNYYNVHMTIFSLYKRALDQKNTLYVNKLWESIGTV